MENVANVEGVPDVPVLLCPSSLSEEVFPDSPVARRGVPAGRSHGGKPFGSAVALWPTWPAGRRQAPAWRCAWVPVDDVLTGRVPPPGACPHCGRGP